MSAFIGVAFAATLGLFGPRGAPATVQLDGVRTEVHWSDGDSFRILSGRHRSGKARLMGYNTLESYGPVHSWGDWNAHELYGIAKRATGFARSRAWTCVTSGQTDHYGRMLVRCDDLIVAMAGEGLGHLFELDTPPKPAAVAAQKKAIAEKKGMWKKGAPAAVMTSLHSIDEKNWDDGKAYNRVADTATGMTRKVPHTQGYGACEKVCMEGSCMLYVPFEQRYGQNRAVCLRHDPAGVLETGKATTVPKAEPPKDEGKGEGAAPEAPKKAP